VGTHEKEHLQGHCLLERENTLKDVIDHELA
jgi:hypothetical protein